MSQSGYGPDGVSKVGLGLETRLETHFCESRFPVSKVIGLETLNTAKKWYSKISIFRRFLFVEFAGKKQPKQVGKTPEI